MFLTDSKPFEMMIFAGELMTKSKGIGRGGHRKGAGRPRFARTGKTSYFSTRLTPKTRDLLEAEARRQGKSLSVVAEYLLQIGLERRAEHRNRPRPLRALFFLIEGLSRTIPAHHQGDPKYSWRSNPYIFDAFRAGVIHMLEVLRPAGEVVMPPGPTREEEDSLVDFSECESPDEYGRIRARNVLFATHFMSLYQEIHDEYGYDLRLSSEEKRAHYGLIDARRDLDLKWEEQK
jgi:hypothetical protein